MKKLMFAAVAALGMVFGAKAETQEYLWTGAAGDGNLWATPGNWTLTNGTTVATAPTKDDNVFFVLKKGDDLTVTVSAENTPVNKLRVCSSLDFASQSKLGKLTLSGAGSLRPYGYSTDYRDYTKKTNFTIYASQTFVCDIPVLCKYSDDASATDYYVFIEGWSATYNKAVDCWGNRLFVRTHGANNTTTFKSSVTMHAYSANTLTFLGDSGDPSGKVYFEGVITADKFGSGANWPGASGAFYVKSTGNNIGKIINGHVGDVYLEVANALSENTKYGDAFITENKGAYTSLVLGGDQTMNCLVDYSTKTFCASDSLNFQVKSTTAYTLTLKGLEDAESGAMLGGSVSLVYDSADKHTQTLRNRTHTTTGSLTVKSGTIALKDAASFTSLANLVIDADGTLDLTADTVASPFGNLPGLTIAAGGLIKIPAGMTMAMGWVEVNGAVLTPGTYSKAKGATWIDGDGVVEVTYTKPVDAVWTGGAGDGKWTSAANWDCGFYPNHPNSVAIFKPMVDATVDIDATDGITLSRFVVTTNGSNSCWTRNVTVTGNKLTLVNAFTSTITPYQAQIMHTATFFSDQNLKFYAPLDLKPSTGGDALMMVPESDFYGKVNFVGKDFYIKTAIKVISKGTEYAYTKNADFWDTFTAVHGTASTEARIGDCGDPSGTVHFYGKVTADKFGPGYIDGSSAGFYLGAADNDIGYISMGWVGKVYLQAENALGEQTEVSNNHDLPGSYATTLYTRLDLGGRNQTLNRLTKANSSRLTPSVLDVAVVSTGDSEHHAPTLTLKGSANAETSYKLSSDISLVYDPTGDYKQTFVNRMHPMTGTITVKGGTLAFTKDTTLPNVPMVTIKAGATLDCSEVTTGVNPFPNNTIFIIEGASGEKAAGKIKSAAGVDFQVGQVYYNGVKQEQATYSTADWLEGGTVEVLDTAPAAFSYWIGTSGNWEDAANWMGGNVPSADTKQIVFDKAQAERVTITLNSAFTTTGLDLVVPNNYTIKVASTGSFVYDNSAYNDTDFHDFIIQAGGEWLNEGTTTFTRFVGKAAVEGKFETTGGTFDYLLRTTTEGSDLNCPLKVPAGGTFVADGGTVLNGGTHFDAVKNMGGKVEYKNLKLEAIKTSGDQMTVTKGTNVLSGTTQIYLGTNKRLTFASESNEVSTVNFEDTAGFDGKDQHRTLLVFGGNVGSTTLVNWNSTCGSYVGAETYIGAEEGVVTNIIAAGKTLKGSIRGVRVGSPTRGVAANSQSGVFGYVLCNGALNSSGSAEAGWDNDYAPNGVLIGYGLGIGAATQVTSVKYRGRVDVPTGGSVSGSSSTSVIGAGYGEGELNLLGGTANLPSSTYTFSGKVLSYSPTIIGFDGGKGTVNVSAGKLTCNSGTLFLGGASTNDFQIMVREGDGVVREWRPSTGCYLADRHDAEGYLVHSGGTVDLKEGMVIGSDGRGKLTLIGDNSEGTFKITSGNNNGCRGLILSNSTAMAASAWKNDAATIKWVANENGLRTIVVSSRRVQISDGAKFEIDLSAVPKASLKGRYCLISAPAVEGMANLTMDKVTLTLPEGVEAPRAIVDNIPGKGIYLRLRPGFVFMFK